MLSCVGDQAAPEKGEASGPGENIPCCPPGDIGPGVPNGCMGDAPPNGVCIGVA